MKYFEALLDRLPALQSVAIKNATGQIPWGIWAACVSRPHIESLSCDAGSYDLATPSSPSDGAEITCVFLQKFSYTTSTWRGLDRRSINMRSAFDFERQCLCAVVLRMNQTAVSLTLPLESTPVHAMAKLPWPNLKELNLRGCFLEATQVKHIQYLLRSLPSLVRLSTLAVRTSEVGRPALLPHPAPSTSESVSAPLLLQLRTLEIAYPNPMDGVFSIAMPSLSHLALRDHPRIFHDYARGHSVGGGPMIKHWHAPLLLDSEILYILRRMERPLLTSLEIVYRVAAEGPDDELLEYIVDAFPNLERLEIHRYGRNRSMLTQHVRLAD